MTYLTFLEGVLTEAADIAKRYVGNVTPQIKPEDNNQVLTEADIAIGKYIIARIEAEYPGHNIIDEESGAIDKNSEFTWVIDPIEGTSNFACGSPHYGIMVGLLQEATPIAGGVIAPSYNALYLAEKGKGATKNGRLIGVTSETNLLHKLVSFGMNGNQNDPDRTRHEAELLAEVALSICNMRSSGCEVIDGMYVAEGIYRGRINMGSKIWDNVAPQIIVEEAGGLWTNIHGGAMDYSQPLTHLTQNFSYCLAPPQLHSQLIGIVKAWEARWPEAKHIYD